MLTSICVTIIKKLIDNPRATGILWPNNYLTENTQTIRSQSIWNLNFWWRPHDTYQNIRRMAKQLFRPSKFLPAPSCHRSPLCAHIYIPYTSLPPCKPALMNSTAAHNFAKKLSGSVAHGLAHCSTKADIVMTIYSCAPTHCTTTNKIELN